MTLTCNYDGRVIRPVDPAAISAYKQGLTIGQVVFMTLEAPDEYRTRKQQGLLHELLGRLARASGESLEAVKVKAKFDLGYWLPADKILSGELDLPKWRGAWIDLHDVYPALYAERALAFLRSEATYTKRMEAEFVDYILTQCFHAGVRVDDIIETIERGENGRRD
jgi:hypothetical protein